MSQVIQEINPAAKIYVINIYWAFV